MEIKAVKFRKDGFYSQPFAFGGEASRARTNSIPHDHYCKIHKFKQKEINA